MKKLVGILTTLLLLAFSGCQIEEPFASNEATQRNKNLNLKRVSYNELIKNKKVAKQLSGIANFKQSLSAGRIVHDTIYDFYVDTDEATFIENGTYQSYTFPIYREDQGGNLENLLLSLNENGEFDTFLVEYSFSQEELQNLNSTQLPNGETHYYKINFDPQSVLNKVSASELTAEYVCAEMQTQVMVPINQGDLTGEFGYEPMWVTTATFCNWVYTYSSGGDGSDDGTVSTSNTSDNGSYDGSSSSTGGTLITAPTILSPAQIRQKDFIKNQLTTTQSGWLANHPDVRDSIFAYLESQAGDSDDLSNYPTEAVAFVIQMINLAQLNNSTFIFDSTLDTSSSLSFDNVTELQNFLNNNTVNNINSFNTEQLPTIGNTWVGRYKLGITILGGVKISINYSINSELNHFTATSVTSEEYGLNIGKWSQNSNTINIRPDGNIRIDVYGNITTDYTVFGFGTHLIQGYHLILIIDSSNGSPISTEWHYD